MDMEAQCSEQTTDDTSPEIPVGWRGITTCFLHRIGVSPHMRKHISFPSYIRYPSSRNESRLEFLFKHNPGANLIYTPTALPTDIHSRWAMDLEEGQRYEQPTYHRITKFVVLLSRRTPMRTANRNITCRYQVDHTILYNGVFVSLNTLLVGLLPVEYQTRSVSPFSEHPANMYIFFIATCLYSLGLIAKKILKLYQSIYSEVLSTVVLISAVVAPLSLALVFLHCSANWVYSILVFVLLVFVVCRYVIWMLKKKKKISQERV